MVRFLFAHGAGAGSKSPWMQHYAARLSTLGQVTTFDYPYMAAGKRLPDRLPVLIRAHAEALQRLDPEGAGDVCLIGKSMGGRVACHVSLVLPVRAVICLGYPLRDRKGTVRDGVLLALKAPVLFVQGSIDPLCPLILFEETRARMPITSEICIINGGDHSLKVRATDLRRQGSTQAQVDERVVASVHEFVCSLATPKG